MAPESLYHRLFVAPSRMGKTETVVSELFDIDGAGVLALDPHGSLVTSYLDRAGNHNDVLYDCLPHFSRFIKYGLLRRSKEVGLKKEIEDDQIIDAAVEGYASQRNIADIKSNPLTEEWLRNAISLVLHNDVSITEITNALRIPSKQFDRLLAGCTDPKTIENFNNLLAMGFKQLRFEIAAASGLLSSAGEALRYASERMKAVSISEHFSTTVRRFSFPEVMERNTPVPTRSG